MGGGVETVSFVTTLIILITLSSHRHSLSLLAQPGDMSCLSLSIKDRMVSVPVCVMLDNG